jgi:hypothetical protein
MNNTVTLGDLFLTEQIRYYKGIHKVKILTKSEGYWMVEALEDFDDLVDSQILRVKAGEQRIVPDSMLSRRKHLAPPFKEHAYELAMEKKLKRMVEREEERENQAQSVQQ